VLLVTAAVLSRTYAESCIGVSMVTTEERCYINIQQVTILQLATVRNA
jgi:hypothetical protein